MIFFSEIGNHPMRGLNLIVPLTKTMKKNIAALSAYA